MNNRQFEETLKRELDNLEREISPSRDLWPGIDHALGNGGFHLSRPAASAAALLLAVTLALSGGYFFGAGGGQAEGVAAVISMLQSEHERNKQSLLTEYRDQTALAPDWEEQMTQLEQAEQAIYEALREDPENIELLKILKQVQTKQIELIESVYAPLFSTI